MDLTTVLAAVRAGVSLIPEGAALVNEVKSLFDTEDQATIEEALQASMLRADRQHEVAQGI